MKRFVAVSLLVGYVMLVPFCFFGGMLMANAHTMNMTGTPPHQMDDCGMLGGCTHGAQSGAIDSIAHHLGMYNSLTHTPLTTLSIIMMALLAVFLFAALRLAHYWLRIFLTQTSLLPPIQRADKLRSKIKQHILTWLSLFEASPNFA